MMSDINGEIKLFSNKFNTCDSFCTRLTVVQARGLVGDLKIHCSHLLQPFIKSDNLFWGLCEILCVMTGGRRGALNCLCMT